jgi:signal peptidase I
VQPASPGIVDMLSNLNVGWILAAVAVLTIIRFNLLKNEGDRFHAIAEYVESGIVAIVLVWMIVRPFAVQAYFIPSPSMEPTLFGENGSGDRILVNKFLYRRSRPQHDDVVVFVPPGDVGGPGITNDGGVPVDDNGNTVNFIKRLVALPGDIIEVHAGVVWINGTPHNHEDVRDECATAHYMGDDAASLIGTEDMLAEHHVRFVTGGVQVDAGKIITPSQLGVMYAGSATATVKIVPGYVTRNGVRLNEPFVAEDPDYDMKIFNGEPLKALSPYTDGGGDQYRLAGQPIDRPTYERDVATPAGKIPPAKLFMMGDNRNDSDDSTEWGPLDADRVIGRAQFIFWPVNRVRVIR